MVSVPAPEPFNVTSVVTVPVKTTAEPSALTAGLRVDRFKRLRPVTSIVSPALISRLAWKPETAIC